MIKDLITWFVAILCGMFIAGVLSWAHGYAIPSPEFGGAVSGGLVAVLIGGGAIMLLKYVR